MSAYQRLTAPLAKYGNRKTEFNGQRYDSKAEARRAFELRALEMNGEITNVETQVTYRLVVNEMLVAKYRCDFKYVDVRTGLIVVEDVKSPSTRKIPSYSIKKKLMKACHDRTVVEVE